MGRMKSCFLTLFPHVSNRGTTVFSRPNWLYPFGADSLSRSVNCAPDENDRPSERTKLFKMTSVYVLVYISELTRT